MNKIEWISLQPLTGGMYLGFEEVFGCPAKCIISYHGLNEYKALKRGESKDQRGCAGNEYSLTEYLKKKGRNVPRYEFVKSDQKTWLGMFDKLSDDNHEYFLKDYDKGTTFGGEAFVEEGVDVVCAVPVCSGLSRLTASGVDKGTRNMNMLELTRFALKILRPKMYVFENAPAFISDSAYSQVRKEIEQLATDSGYSLHYIFTDSKLHYNCQRRPRTFVIMTRSKAVPLLADFENKGLKLEDMLRSIPKDAPQYEFTPRKFHSIKVMEYMKDRHPENWREFMLGDALDHIMKSGEKALSEFMFWLQGQRDDEKTSEEDKKLCSQMIKQLYHIVEQSNIGKGYWSSCPKAYAEQSPAVCARTIYAFIHPYEDRLLNERELMTLMGMPTDFEMQGNFRTDGRKIGQNVPRMTASWIAKWCRTVVEDWNHLVDKDTFTTVQYTNNVRQFSRYVGLGARLKDIAAENEVQYFETL